MICFSHILNIYIYTTIYTYYCYVFLIYFLSFWSSCRCWCHCHCSVTKSHIQLFATPWTAACQAPLSYTISWSLLTFMSIDSVILSNHLILCYPLFLLPSVFPSIGVFSNESALHISWPKDWSFSFSISPSRTEYSRLVFFLGFAGLISFQLKGLSRVFSSTTIWKHQFFGAQPSLLSNSHIWT